MFKELLILLLVSIIVADKDPIVVDNTTKSAIVTNNPIISDNNKKSTLVADDIIASDIITNDSIFCDNNKKPSINVLVIKEVKNSWEIIQPLMEFFVDDDVKAIVLMIETNGGYFGHAMAFSIAKAIQTLKTKYKKPVIAYGEICLTNAAYVIACAADTIMASSCCELGHIGIAPQYYLDQSEKNGLDGHIINALCAGKYKLLSHSDLPMSQERLDMIQKNNDLLFDSIVKHLIALRPGLATYKKHWIDGQIFLPNQQVDKEHFFIDAIGDKLDLNECILQKIRFNSSNLNSAETPQAEVIIRHANKDLKSLQHTNTQKNNIAVLNAKDCLKWEESNHYLETLLEVFKDPTIHGIIISIDCDGADSCGVMSNLFSHVKKLKMLYKKPIVAYIDCNAWSGGYWLACATDYIIASPLAQIGSVGIRTERWNRIQANTKEHKKYYSVISNKYMNMYNEYTEQTEDEKKMQQEVIENLHKQFIEHVKDGRPHLCNNETEWREAQVYGAQQALEIGLIDAIGSPLDAVQCINQDLDLKNIQFVFKDFTLVEEKKS